MENITKALLIAAGVLIAIILLTLLVIGYNQISGYYQQQSDTVELKQIMEMSKKFINYEEKTIRGNEMLSVINMVVDYNEWVNENPNNGYEKITLKISFEDVNNYYSANKYDSFHIVDDSNINYLIPAKLQENCITNNSLEIFSLRVTYLLNELEKLITPDGLITNENVKSETTLQLLSSNVHNINDWLTNNSNTDEENFEMARLLDNILKTQITNTSNLQEIKNKLNRNKSTIEKIRNIAAQYYEITQFKRANFFCENIKLNSNNRVTGMTFKVNVTSDGLIKFN